MGEPLAVESGCAYSSVDSSRFIVSSSPSPLNRSPASSSHAPAQPSTSLTEEHFRGFVTASADVVYRMSPDWGEMRRLEGKDFLPDTSNPNRSWLEKYLLPEDRAFILGKIDEAIREKKMFALEHRVIRVDGSVGWTISRAVPLLNRQDEIIEWMGTASDVTERKRAEEALARITMVADQERRLYRTILSATPDLVYVFGLDHRFTYANQALLTMWGRTWEDAIGKNCLELGYPDWHAAMHDREIEQVIATKKPIRGDVPFNGTGGRRIYDYIFVPVFGADGEVEAIAGTTRDVTERKQTEEALANANKLLADRAAHLDELVQQRTVKLRDTVGELEAFSYSIAHDLRSPLRSLQGFSDVLIAEYSAQLPPEAQSFLRRIGDSAGRMDKLVQEVLNYSRLVRGDLAFEPVNLDTLVRGIVDIYPTFAPDKAEIILETQLPIVIGNEAMLTQVFSNLLGNAVKFVAPGVKPRIRIEAEARGERVRVVVRDNGIGIASDQQEKIWGIFQQAVRGYGGTGIGLAIVKKAAERMGGSAGVDSREGEGSAFWLEIRKAGS